jgi:hypothetical protein
MFKTSKEDLRSGDPATDQALYNHEQWHNELTARRLVYIP